MTDEELIARLRSNIFGTGTTMLAADRLETLLVERKKDHANINLKADFIDKTINQLAETEAKLAKAVEALHNAAIQLDWCQAAREISKEIDATLAEIKGTN